MGNPLRLVGRRLPDQRAAESGRWRSAPARRGNLCTVREVASRHVPYLPGVDGLRAVAVAAVVLYHADVAWLPAGFLGVDVFFAVSGYLIASMLLAEHAAQGFIVIGAFWRRRARRLLPGVFVLLAGVPLASLLVARDGGGRLVGDLPAAA